MKKSIIVNKKYCILLEVWNELLIRPLVKTVEKFWKAHNEMFSYSFKLKYKNTKIFWKPFIQIIVIKIKDVTVYALSILVSCEGAHHRIVLVCDENEAEKLRKKKKWQTLEVLEDGFMEGVTRNHYSFAIFPDEEKAIYVRHRKWMDFKSDF